MRGRAWLVIGVVIGIAVGLGRLPYLAGAGRSLADTCLRLVDSGAKHIISGAAHTGAPQRLVLGIAGLIAVMLPGVASLLLVVAARGTLRLRSIIALAVMALGASSFVYQSHGRATGVLILAMAVAGIAIALTGPLVAAPLAGVAALIATQYLPTLVEKRQVVAQASVAAVHLAVFNKVGTPAYLQVLLLIAAAIPFAIAARLVLSS